MNPFHQAILTSGKDIENLTLRLTQADTTLDSFYWFIGYRTADFNGKVANDKDLFFIYSTDHSTGPGGIKWGKGNNSDLTDFEEVGLIWDGDQAETPQLLLIPEAECGDTEELHLFFHTNATETGNDGKQQTRLITSAGGNELHLNTWTDRGRPLGIVGDENHTGYHRGYKRGVSDYITTHIGKGGLPQPWKFSTSTDGRNYTRGSEIDVINGTEPGYFAQISDGIYFEKYGQQWWIGQLHPESGSGIFDADKRIALCKAVTPYGALEQLKLLNNGKENLRHTVMIDGDVANIFITNPKDNLYHGTYDLTDLQNYL